MVYALKSYNNNRTYKRAEDKNVLDMIIQRFSAEPTKGYVSYPNTKKSFMDKSVQKLAVNSIIEGYFPKENVVRQMAIKRVNKMLCVAIGLLIAVVVISYFFVISCEMQLNELSKQTIMLNNENEELQKLHRQDPAWCNIICRCEKISEAEIVEAVKRGHTTVDGVKFYTRAGMGRCQGGFCSAKILQIISKTSGIPLEKLTKRGSNSPILAGNIGDLEVK